MQAWTLYLIRCADNSLYCGITTDIERRFQEHSEGGTKSAKYLRGRAPLKLVFTTGVEDKSTALKLELAVKKLSRQRKEALIQQPQKIHDLL